jgi:hypothetical protein
MPNAFDRLAVSEKERQAVIDEKVEKGLQGKLGKVEQVLQDPVKRVVGRRIVECLQELDLGEVLLEGWSKKTDLVDAARETLDNPGVPKVVPLDTHSVAHNQDWTIDVLVDDARLFDFVLKFSVDLTVKALEAELIDGRLRALHSGTVDIFEGIDVDDEPDPEYSHLNTIDLPGTVTLPDDGFPLVPDGKGSPARLEAMATPNAAGGDAPNT